VAKLAWALRPTLPQLDPRSSNNCLALWKLDLGSRAALPKIIAIALISNSRRLAFAYHQAITALSSAKSLKPPKNCKTHNNINYA
jgi:hypothetical protein